MNALAALLLVSTALPAGLGDRTVERWSVEEGLPNNALTSVLQTRDGYLWVATWAGVVRFDGVRFTPVAEDLPNDHARVVFEDRDGGVWIGVGEGGLTHLKADRQQVLNAAGGLAGDDVRALAQDTAGHLWVATENGVSILDGERPHSLRAADGLPDDSVSCLAAARDGRVFVATAGGVCSASAREPRCVPVQPARATGAVATVLVDSAERLWVGARNGLFSVAPGSPCEKGCFQGNAVRSLLQARDGSLWVGFDDGGLARLDAKGGIERAGLAEGLPAGPVVSLFEDREGSLWAGVYNGGLARLKPKRVATFSRDQGLPTEVVGSIVERADGSIWAGSQCGPVAELRDGRFVPRFAEHTKNACAWLLWPARDGSLWIGTRNDGVFRWDGRRMQHLGAASGLSDLHVAGLFEDRDGTLWIGTEYGGVHTYAGGRLSRAYGAADGLATGYVASFAQDREGRVWIGSNANGLSVYEGGRFRTLPPGEAPPTRNIAGLLVDSRGDLWIGSAANGLFRRRDGRYQSFGVAEGLGDRLVAVMLEDRTGDMWVGTARGISRLTRERIEAVAAGRERSLDPIILDRSDGMRHIEGSGGGLDPSGLRDRHGRLWFSTIDGIAVVDPAAFRTNQLPPPLLIETARLAGRETAVAPDRPIEVPPGTPSVELSYTAFSLLAPAKVRFRYRLLGTGEGWQNVGGRRVAYYGRLAPGTYTFELLAANNDGVWSPAPARARLRVAPFWWERASVRFGALGAVLLLTGAGVRSAVLARARSRLRELERERALESERSRIARDLHDDLGARLTRIALMADRTHSAPESARVSHAAREAVETLDELVWAVNAKNDTVEAFAQYASRFAEEHLSAAELRCRLELQPELASQLLPADARRHLFLAFKEAVNNAIKHARATEVRVRLAVQDGFLDVEVVDDGRGLPEAARDPTGNGLGNMRERMELAGGSLRVDSAPGAGTRIGFRVPLG